MAINFAKLSGVVRSPRLFNKSESIKLDFQLENQYKKVVERIDCSVWGDLAQLMYDNVKEGETIKVEGYLRKNTWKSLNGEWNVKTFISVDKYEVIEVDNVYSDERMDGVEFDNTQKVDQENEISSDDLPY